MSYPTGRLSRRLVLHVTSLRWRQEGENKVNDLASSKISETLLVLGGLLFGSATVVVVVAARRKVNSLRRRSLYTLLGFVFNFLSCLSLEGLVFISSDISGFRAFLPVLLTIGLGRGLFGAAWIVQSTCSLRKLQKLEERSSGSFSDSGGEENG